MTRYRLKDFKKCVNERSGIMVRCTLCIAADNDPVVEIHGCLILRDFQGKLKIKPPMTQGRYRVAVFNPDYAERWIAKFVESRPTLAKSLGKVKSAAEKAMGEIATKDLAPVGDEFDDIEKRKENEDN